MIGYALFVVVACALFTPQVLCYDFQNTGTCGVNPWIKHGCRIALDHELKVEFDVREKEKHNIDWKNLYIWLTKFACMCRKAALASKKTFFGLGDYGLCFSGTGLKEYMATHELSPPKSCIGALKHNHTVVNEKTGEICLAGYSRIYLYEIVPDSQNPSAMEGNNKEAEVPVEKICTAMSDIIIILDASGSVEDEFVKMKEFAKKLASRFEVGEGSVKSRLSIVSFADKVDIPLSWPDSQLLTKGEINSRIDKIQYDGGNTATFKAINVAVDNIIKPFSRSGVTPTIFLITDGVCYNGDMLLTEPIKRLRATNARVIAIGVGEADKHELEKITNKGELAFYYKNFQHILDMAASILNNLVLEACV